MQDLIFYPADIFSLTFFSFFCVIMTALIVFAVWRTQYQFKKFVTLFFSYLLIFSLIVQSDLLIQHPIPFIPILFLSVLIFAVVSAFSGYGRLISEAFSLKMLVGFQGFRLLLELILHHWAEIKTIPENC